ncbi:MAG: hypothetical protein EBU90_08240 [Proteobacteria bacterium]|nr:hypothetical protein [Pseudomonadota bacterium]NBP15635.1 hypothetical protein [bacterium]
MKAQLDNILMSSMTYWVDNILLRKGQAYTNYGGLFYPIDNAYSNYYTYGLPFRQIVADSSINGANLLSGVYINGNFVEVGQNGLIGINPNLGQIYFNSNQGANIISGNYAVKDMNVYITSDPEENILFETQYKIKPKTYQNPTGIASNALTYPAVFLKNNGGYNSEFAFGGEDKTEINIRAIVLADNNFHLDAVFSIFRDAYHSYIPLIDLSESPYNSINSIKIMQNSGSYYNYNSLSAGKVSNNRAFYIERVESSNILNIDNKLNPSIYPGIVDFTLSNIRYPRV